jgi:outer membrane receptor protein involved in Fe transport
VTFDVTPNQTVGFTFSQGYRAGFADYFPFQGAFFGIYRVQPETLNAYEVSYRSRWLNDSLNLNANIFYYDYKNQQVAFEPPGTLVPGYAVITNAKKSHSYGAEFEARYRFNGRFSAYASIGLLYTHFDDIVVPATGNFSGNQFPEAPGYTVNVGGLYQDPLGWFVGANARFVDGFYSYGDLANTPARFVNNAMIVDARAGWEFKNNSSLPFHSSKLTVFAKNLFDEQYLTYISNPSNGVRTAGVGDTRQVGVQLSAKY